MNAIVNLDIADPADASDEDMGHAVISAETYVQIATAKKFRRSITRFRQSLQAQASGDMSIARQCHYAIPRAGKTIEGPSIRFAEMVLQAWGNAHAGTRIVAELDRFVVAQGVFYDLESNVRITEEVQRRITNNKGERFDTDMIGVSGAAARSIALRNAILRGVPKALWWDGYASARLTIVGDIKTMKAKREDALAYFRSLGVADAQVYATLGVPGLADIGAEQLLALAGFRTSIEDEGKDPEFIFRPAETKARVASPPQPAPGGASPASDPPTQDKGPAPPGTSAPKPTPESPPAASPASAGPAAQPLTPGDAPPIAKAPAETFSFASRDAALVFAAEMRESLNDAGSEKAVRKLLKGWAVEMSGLHAFSDEGADLATGLHALAADLIEAFAQDAAR